MKSITLAASIAACLAFSGCAGTTTLPAQTPAQIAATVCPTALAEISTLQASGIFTGGAATTFTTKIQPDINAVCAPGVIPTVATLTTLMQTTFPAVVTIIGTSSLSEQDKSIAVLSVGALEAAIAAGIQLQATASVAASAAVN